MMNWQNDTVKLHQVNQISELDWNLSQRGCGLNITDGRALHRIPAHTRTNQRTVFSGSIQVCGEGLGAMRHCDNDLRQNSTMALPNGAFWGSNIRSLPSPLSSRFLRFMEYFDAPVYSFICYPQIISLY